jgi:phenylalanyl-tRNA synthetase beta chain
LKFSYRWLGEMVPGLSNDPVDLERLITIKTAECEGIEQWGAERDSDWVIEIDNKSLTHRPDLWGHLGMAREVAAITGRTLSDPVHLELLPPGGGQISVEIEDHSLCPRYSALIFENVTVAPSPSWLQARLEAIGLKPINNIVDVTNYILAELPQPMHAFDAARLNGSTIFVRRAKNGEQLKALNDESYALAESDLVIADAQGPIALAGVIGGVESAISAGTTRIVLESANFQAASVRLTSSRHKLHTDASMRFEKSLDPENTVRGLARAVELLKVVSPGIRLAGGVTDNYGPHAHPPPIDLPVEFMNRKLGETLTGDRITNILKALGFAVEIASPGRLLVTVPSWRATKDISLREDLVEEVGRMVGYGEITPEAPLLPAVVPPPSPMRLYLRSVRSRLVAQGFTEVHNYSFTNENQWKPFGLTEQDHLRVKNPIAAELTHMRRSLLPGVFETIVKNTRHFRDFRFFEIGGEIQPQSASLHKEVQHAVAASYGAQADEREFFELTRVAECLFPQAQLKAAEPRAWEHPFRAAEIHWHGQEIGRLFELHPSLLDAEKLEGRAFLFDVDLDLAQSLGDEQVRYKPLRRYPTSAFDLSVIADLRRPVAQIHRELARLGGDAVVSIDFVRQYAGPPLEHGQKSVSYRIELGAADRTLTNEEVSEVRSSLIEGMRGAGYELRV